jgi:hypothetical protein
VVQFSGVARILKMVENSVAEHQQEYTKVGTHFLRNCCPLHFLDGLA